MKVNDSDCESSFQNSSLRADIQLHNHARTEIRSCLGLRSTVMGSNNRLDVEKIVSYDRGNSAVSMIGAFKMSETCMIPAIESLAPSSSKPDLFLRVYMIFQSCLLPIS